MRRLRSTLRGILSALACAALAATAGCGGIDASGFSGDANVLLARGAAYAAYLAARDPAELSDAEVIALGYLERARQGLGSPFRLTDFALNDPDLPDLVRERVAYAILSQVATGQVYEVDPAVLDVVRLAGVRPGQRSGPEQMRIIEREIASAPTATSGERAVRLGYRLAEAERTIAGVPQSVVAHVAALVSDRRRAREDLARLLRNAAARDADPLELLQRWRSELRFQVERPALLPVTVREEAAEARDGPKIAVALRSLAQRLSAPTSLVALAQEEDEPRSLLSAAAADRLLELAERRDYPAQAPVAVAVAINRESLISRPGLEEWQREARAHFAETAWNEERLVASARRLRALGAGRGPRLTMIELQAATFLRGWSQEEPWYPGDAAPQARDLEARFGLRGVEIAPEVPDAWRPYYLRMLARGLTDLQRVLPTATVRGLRVRIGPLPRDVRALALHEPRTRTLFLPTRTGSGTLAHEIAHDLDWQLARSRYQTRGGYATDLAVRTHRGDRIASSLVGLAAALSRPGSPDTVPNPHETRPAEIFARGMDWLVAAVLARDGRTGGYLTSFQDAALTGYGTTRGPDVGGGAVPALLSILEPVAPVVDPTRGWALETYGPARALSPTELAGAILAAGAERASDGRIAAIRTARDRSLAALSTASCRLSSVEGMRRLVDAQRALIRASTGAAARGAAIDGVRALVAEQLGPAALGAADAWLAWRLYGAPEPLDSTLVPLIPAFEDLLYRAETLEREEPDFESSGFGIQSNSALCGGNPFASALARPRGRLLHGGPPGPAREAPVGPLSPPSASPRLPP